MTVSSLVAVGSLREGVFGFVDAVGVSKGERSGSSGTEGVTVTRWGLVANRVGGVAVGSGLARSTGQGIAGSWVVGVAGGGVCFSVVAGLSVAV